MRTRSRRPWQTKEVSRRGWIVIASISAGAAITGVLAGVLLSQSNANVAGEWGKALLTLFVGTVIGGLLTFILSEYARDRQQKAAERDQALNWLHILLEANHRVQAARVLLSADQSVRVYEEQIRTMIEVTVSLRGLREDLEADMANVAYRIKNMLSYLDKLGVEMSRAQTPHEGRVRRYLLRRRLPRKPIADATDPWPQLQGNYLSDFLRAGETYQGCYQIHYHEAKELLRERLRGATPPPQARRQ